MLNENDFLLRVILPHPLVWNGLIKRRLFDSYRLQFRKDAWPREDLVFHLDMGDSDFTGVYTGKTTYIYRYCISNSLSNSITLRSIENHIGISIALTDIINKRSQGIQQVAKSELMNTLNSFFRNLPRITQKDRTCILNRFKDSPIFKPDPYMESSISALTKVYYNSPILYRCLCFIIHSIIPSHKKIK